MYAVGRDPSEYDASIILTTKIIHRDLDKLSPGLKDTSLFEGKLISQIIVSKGVSYKIYIEG